MIRNRPECFKAEYKTAAKNIRTHINFMPFTRQGVRKVCSMNFHVPRRYRRSTYSVQRRFQNFTIKICRLFPASILCFIRQAGDRSLALLQ